MWNICVFYLFKLIHCFSLLKIKVKFSMAKVICKTILFWVRSKLLDAVMFWHYPTQWNHIQGRLFQCLSHRKSEVVCSIGNKEGSSQAALYLNEAQLYVNVALNRTGKKLKQSEVKLITIEFWFLYWYANKKPFQQEQDNDSSFQGKFW